jgi:hypothetical protein
MMLRKYQMVPPTIAIESMRHHRIWFWSLWSTLNSRKQLPRRASRRLYLKGGMWGQCLTLDLMFWGNTVVFWRSMVICNWWKSYLKSHSSSDAGSQVSNTPSRSGLNDEIRRYVSQLIWGTNHLYLFVLSTREYDHFLVHAGIEYWDAVEEHFPEKRRGLIAFLTKVNLCTFPERMTACPWEINSDGELRFTVPSTIVTIDEYMFGECRPRLRSVQMPASVQIFGRGCFYQNFDLSVFQFEPWSALMNIGAHAFVNCWSLRSICIPRSVEVLCSGCFSGCTSLSDIQFELPSKLSRIERMAFTHCCSLESICLLTQLNSLPHIVSIHVDLSALSHFNTIPNWCKSKIGYWATVHHSKRFVFHPQLNGSAHVVSRVASLS